MQPTVSTEFLRPWGPLGLRQAGGTNLQAQLLHLLLPAMRKAGNFGPSFDTAFGIILEAQPGEFVFFKTNG